MNFEILIIILFIFIFFLVVISKRIKNIFNWQIILAKPVKIYIIRVLGAKNKVLYVGQTSQPLEKRFVQHIIKAKNNEHNNKKLQEYLKKHSHCCVIEQVDETSYNNANNLEKYYIEKFENKYLCNIMMRD